MYISTEFDSHTAALGVICRVVQGLGETGFSVGKLTISWATDLCQFIY